MIDRKTDPVGWELRHLTRARELYLDWAMSHPRAKPFDQLQPFERHAWVQRAKSEEDLGVDIPFATVDASVVFPRWQNA
jgi:hypothetical protein